MTTIHIAGLHKTFAGTPPHQALRGVDLAVGAGQFLAVLGPSGCGKTSLLRALAGVDPADGGTIRLGDRVVDDGSAHEPPERRRIGLVPQEGALFPHLDVDGNVAFGLRGVDAAERRRRIDELLDLVGLAGFGRRRPHELSGGQQQRVALARALAPRPEVVLLDEPFSALDAALRVTLREHMGEVLRAAGTTVVLVTHDQDEAMTFADRIAVMWDGEIVQSGEATELYRAPVDLRTARFLGTAVVVSGSRPERGGDGTAATTVDTVLGRLDVATACTDRPDGLRTAGSSTGHDAVSVMLRPEQLRLAPPDGPLVAVVERVRFHGSFADVALRISGGAEGADDVAVEARWQTTDLPSVGDTVGLRVAGPVMVYPAP